MKTNHGCRAFTANAMLKQQHHSSITRMIAMLTLLLIVPFALRADFNYTISDGEVTITEYTGPGGAVVIPSLIEGHPVVHIGNSAFRNHDTVTSVVIPDGVKSIGDRAFQGCNYLINVTIPDSVTSIGDRAFNACYHLRDVHIPNSVIEIGAQAFRDCYSLTSIAIPSGVTTIEARTFERCTSLIQVTLPIGVTNISSSAFQNCLNLNNIVIPEGVISIGSSAFRNCPALTNVVIPDSVVDIGFEAFYGCTSLVSINIPGSVATIGNQAFAGSTALQTIDVDDVNATYTSLDGVLFNKDQTILMQFPAGKEGFYTIPAGVSIIANGAFQGSAGLTGIDIPEGLTSIGEWAFRNCTGLTDVTIPDSVTAIGIYAFSNCENLTSIHLSAGLTTIVEGLLSGCESLVGVTLPDGVNAIGRQAFAYCTGLTSLTIPSSVVTIGDDAFFETSLTHLTIPEGVQSLSATALRRCYSLITLALPASLTSIGDRAFEQCPSLTAINVNAANPVYSSVDGILFNKNQTVLIRYPAAKSGNYTIPLGVTEIASYAFDGCSDLTAITIPAAVNSIGYRSFADCTSLTSIVIPANVTALNTYAFLNCTSLTSIVLPAGLTSIGNSAFYGCTSLVSIELPAGLTSISALAFYQCTSLTSIMIPANVASIADSAFRHCTNLQAIDVDEANTVYSSLDGVMFNKDRTRLLRFPAGKAGYYAVPETVTVIERDAFRDSAGLTGVDIPDSVTEIGWDAFSHCTGLTDVVIPDSVTILGYSAFRQCIGLTNVNIGTGITRIEGHLFNGCTSLANVTIPESVNRIRTSAFRDCVSLTSVYIPDGVTIIEEEAFRGCTSLTTITIPAGLFVIGEAAFRDCTHLTEVLFEGDAPGYGADVFLDADQVIVYRLAAAMGWPASGELWAERPTALWGIDADMWPAGGVELVDRRPAFNWPTTPGATWYRIWINRNGATYLDEWIQGSPPWTPTTALPSGNYRWWIQPWSPSTGSGAWSTAADFSIRPLAPSTPPTLLAPIGDVSDTRRPAFVWSSVADATYYRVYVQVVGGDVVIDQWVASVTNLTHAADLPAGEYRWWVMAWGPDGSGPWSTGQTFSLVAQIPGMIELLAPEGIQTEHDLVYGWSRDTHATWYRLWIGTVGGTTWYDKWHAATEDAVQSVMVPNHPQGVFDWWLRGWAPDGSGPWSGPMTFSTPSHAPAKTVLVGPAGMIVSNPPTFEWEAAARAAWYRIYVQRGSVKVIDQWIEADPGLDLYTWTPASALTTEEHAWWIGSWNEKTKATVWSDRMNFTVP